VFSGGAPTPTGARAVPARTGVWTFLGRKRGCSPEGTADNSPAVHCRAHVGTKRVPKGRLNSIPQILLVEFDPVLLQQRQEFLLAGVMSLRRCFVLKTK